MSKVIDFSDQSKLSEENLLSEANPEINKEQPTRPQECNLWDGCSAPFCPLDGGDVWYPDEEICKSRKYGGVDWVRNQRKITKKTIDDYSYYTIRMLEQNCKISKGIMGLNPDLTLDRIEREEEKWLKKHPEKKEKTQEEKEEIRKRFNRGLE